LIAAALVILAAVWILSGRFGDQTEHVASTPVAAEAAIPPQRVSVTPIKPVPHQRQVVLSCTTRADHKASAVARGAGVIAELNAERGAEVHANDVIAKISDEGRAAGVAQAQSALDQARLDFDTKSKLIASGDISRNTQASLQAAVASAEAALAAAKAEADRSVVHAPIDGVINTVPVQLGQAVQAGTEIASVVEPDPMLAVGAISEARRIQVAAGQPASIRFIDGKTIDATVSFVSLSAETATRTYPVEAKIANADGAVADGVTCEMTVTLAAETATPVPRSALVFSDAGQLGVRTADKDGKVHFLPLGLVDDGRDTIWVSGIDAPTSLIVVGQDFVKDGDTVETVPASPDATKGDAGASAS
jgi:multidrug efflux system membrane fusion protein